MSEIPAYLNENLNAETRAKDLVSRMTLEEKVMQMLHNAPAIPRLKVPSYNWWNEALHGVARAGVATMFPQAIGMAATFDDELMYKVADVISTEGRAKYHESQRKNDHGIYKGLTFWSPNINIFRDPRWGRGHETYGEDPYLTGKLGKAFVRGIQGDDPKHLKAAACAKHYAVHSGPEADRHSFNAIVSKKDLWETYLPAFRELVCEAKVEAIMGAYNRVNGEPCNGSKTLLGDILRGAWDFEGHVTSDCWAIRDFHETHGVTHTAVESVALAVNSGCDLNCGNLYVNLLIAHKEGLVTEEAIDKCVTRLMKTRIKLGMFDDQQNVKYSTIPYEVVECDEHKALALETAKKSMVLLKNKDKLLPINKNEVNTIAVIGPNANSREALVGNYAGFASRYFTVLEGIQEAVKPGTKVYYSLGCHLYKDKIALGEPGAELHEALTVAERSDVVVLCLGLDASIEGEQGDASNADASGDKKHLNLYGRQQELLERITALGKPVILVLLSGSAIAVKWADENVPAIIQAWYPGAEGGKAVASLIFGDYSPAGRLPVTFYNSTENLPDFSDYSMENRTYRYMQMEALYPFGYGLSYTDFEYSDLKLSKQTISPNECLACEVSVKNAGSIESDEVVQLYLTDIEASVRVPRWQLRGVKRIHLKPGQIEKISFTLTPEDMAMVDNEGKRVIEPGEFKIYAGGSQPDSRSIKLMGRSVLTEYFSINGEVSLLD